MCEINPCITAFGAMYCHGSQAAGSGDQSALAQPRDTGAADDGRNGQQPQHSVRIVHGRLTVANDHLARSDLKVHGGRKVQHVEAPSGTDSSGQPRAPRPYTTADAHHPVHPSIVEGTGEWRAVARAEQKSDRQQINPTACPSVYGGPQAARSTICGIFSAGS